MSSECLDMENTVPPFIDFKRVPETQLVESKDGFKLVNRFFTDLIFDDFLEAYNYAINKGFQVVFDCKELSNMLEKEKDNILFHKDDLIIFKGDYNEDSIVRKLCRGGSSNEQSTKLSSAYNNFISELTINYEENKEDWLTCYKWLAHHPAFWHRTESSQGLSHWIVNDGLSSAQFIVSWDEPLNGDHVFVIHGESIKPDATIFNHDENLSVVGSSHEDCIIKLAAAVKEHYYLDGTHKN